MLKTSMTLRKSQKKTEPQQPGSTPGFLLGEKDEKIDDCRCF